MTLGLREQNRRGSAPRAAARGSLAAILALTCGVAAAAPGIETAGSGIETAGCPDADRDGICDADDNCSLVPNPHQVTPLRLNLPLQQGHSVKEFDIAPDGSWVVYGVDGSVGGLFQLGGLYRVPVIGGSVTELLPPDPAAWLGGFRISPDGSHVVFRLASEVSTRFDLFSVPAADGEVRRLNGPLVAGGSVEEFSVSNDGTRVVYRADQITDDVFELYSVPTAGGDAVKLNGELVAGGVVGAFAIDPTSSRVGYVADATADETFQLFSVPLAGGEPTRLNGELTAGGDVESFVFSPDGARAVYLADQRVFEQPELFSVPAAGGAPVRLNGALDPSSAVGEYRITPDSSQVVFTVDASRLFRVPLAGGEALEIAVVDDARGLRELTLTADSRRAVYVDEFPFSVPLEGGPPVQLADTKPPGTGRFNVFVGVGSLRVTPNSARVLWSWVTPNITPAHSVPVTGGEPVVLHDDDWIRHAAYPFEVSTTGALVFQRSQSYDFDPFLWELMSIPAAGGPMTALAPASDWPFDFRWSPAGFLLFLVRPPGVGGTSQELFSIPSTGDPAGADRDGDGAGGACDCDERNPVCSAVCTDGDLDGVGVCQGDCGPECTIEADCDDANASTYPGAPEINDARDNQCPGDLGFGIVDEIAPALRFESVQRLCWEAQAGATGYDIAAASDALFTGDCWTASSSEGCIDGTPAPAPGTALFFLVRASSPNPGSWGSTSGGDDREVPCS